MTDRLVSDERIAELAASVFEEMAQKANEPPFDPTRWSVPSMTFEEAAQQFAALLRQAVQEAGEAAAKVCDNHQMAYAAAMSIRKRLPKPPE